MAEDRIQRRLAAIFVADMVGYSRLIGADEEGTIARQKAHRAELIDPEIANHGGRIVKTMGDGLLVEFASVVDAVKCAVAVQQAMSDREADVPEERRIQFRIGINLGDIVIDGDDILGDGVNIAARLEGEADPGGICISGDVYRQVLGKINHVFEDLGERTLKNIAAPVSVYQLKPKSNGAEAKSGPDAVIKKSERPCIVVLPFDNMSGDSEQEYFADGITEDIITELSKWGEFSVIARNSAFTYKGQAIKVQKVADDLGADFVLEGSVRKSGERVRITGQFIDAHTGHHVWADKFDESGDDLFDLQDRVTRKIVTTLGGAYGQIRKNEYQRVWSKPASSLDEYDCFLRGHSVFYGFTAEAMKEARDIWSEGLARFPNSGLLKIKIGWTHIIDATYGYTPDPVAALTGALALSEEGLADKNLPQAGQRYGLWQRAALLLWLKRDHANALRVAKSVCQLFSFDGEGLALMTQIANYCGEVGLAEEWMKESIVRDPHVPELALKNFGVVMYSLGDFDAAIDFLEKTSVADPEVLRYRAASLAAAGRLDGARAVIAELTESLPGASLAMFGQLIPYRNPEDLERELEHLRLAGLPES